MSLVRSFYHFIFGCCCLNVGSRGVGRSGEDDENHTAGVLLQCIAQRYFIGRWLRRNVGGGAHTDFSRPPSARHRTVASQSQLDRALLLQRRRRRDSIGARGQLRREFDRSGIFM